MGRGGYLGGSTIVVMSVPRKRKANPKASVPEDYDFERRAAGISKALRVRKEKILEGREVELIASTYAEKKVRNRKGKRRKK